VLGVDHAPAMLSRARQDCPRATFEEGDLATWEPRHAVDVLFANAVFHWLPDHATLFPRVFSWLRPGGVLAVQMPRNFHEPSHRLMREVPGPWSEAVAAFKFLNPVREPAYYYDLLATDAAAVDLWQTTYEHVLASAGEIVEWVKGAGLRPYLDATAPALRPAYLAAYEEALAAAYPARIDGRRLFSFPRLFLVAVRR
jgi:trans-aconitate 2-methyltransferase